jgi:hypothetical protein
MSSNLKEIRIDPTIGSTSSSMNRGRSPKKKERRESPFRRSSSNTSRISNLSVEKILNKLEKSGAISPSIVEKNEKPHVKMESGLAGEKPAVKSVLKKSPGSKKSVSFGQNIIHDSYISTPIKMENISKRCQPTAFPKKIEKKPESFVLELIKPIEKSKETSKETTKETTKEIPKEISKEISKETLKETTKEIPKEISKEISKEKQTGGKIEKPKRVSKKREKSIKTIKIEKPPIKVKKGFVAVSTNIEFLKIHNQFVFSEIPESYASLFSKIPLEYRLPILALYTPGFNIVKSKKRRMD